MDNFDIQRVKQDLIGTKRQYAEMLELYSNIKAQSNQLSPEIEQSIYNVEKYIQEREAMIANYEDLQSTLYEMEQGEKELLEHVRRVRARFE